MTWRSSLSWSASACRPGSPCPRRSAPPGRFVHPALAHEVGDLLRRAARDGLGHALAAADGRGRPLYAGAARAVVTGAPLAPAVDAVVREAIAGQRAADLEAARRLPVRLMLPLALLILPGFVLLTVGPTVLAGP